jgi:copper chaperone CopZ
MAQSQATIRTTTLRAQDLSCPSCVAKIEKSLTSLAGVESAEVQFATGRITVRLDAARASRDQLIAAVADAGYTAKASAF